MKKHFGGRPKLPKQAVRDQRIVTFLTKEERRLLRTIAEDANVSVSKACHDLVVRRMEVMLAADDTPLEKSGQ